MIIRIHDKITDEKLQHDIIREAANVPGLPSGKIDKNQYPPGEEILTSDYYRLIEQAKFAYSSLGKAFEKQIRTIEGQRRKQVEPLKVFKPVEHQQKPESIQGIFSEDLGSSEIIKNQRNETKKLKEQINSDDLVYKEIRIGF